MRKILAIIAFIALCFGLLISPARGEESDWQVIETGGGNARFAVSEILFHSPPNSACVDVESDMELLDTYILLTPGAFYDASTGDRFRLTFYSASSLLSADGGAEAVVYFTFYDQTYSPIGSSKPKRIPSGNWAKRSVRVGKIPARAAYVRPEFLVTAWPSSYGGSARVCFDDVDLMRVRKSSSEWLLGGDMARSP